MKDQAGKFTIVEFTDSMSQLNLAEVDLPPTKANMSGISFDIGRFMNMILLAVGDTDGFLTVLSLLSLKLLHRVKVQKDYDNIAVM